MPNIALRLPDPYTPAQIATAVRSELAVELARIDVATSTRASAVDIATLLSRLTAVRAGLLDNLTRLDVNVSSAGGTAHVDIA